MNPRRVAFWSLPHLWLAGLVLACACRPSVASPSHTKPAELGPSAPELAVHDGQAVYEAREVIRIQVSPPQPQLAGIDVSASLSIEPPLPGRALWTEGGHIEFQPRIGWVALRSYKHHELVGAFRPGSDPGAYAPMWFVGASGDAALPVPRVFDPWATPRGHYDLRPVPSVVHQLDLPSSGEVEIPLVTPPSAGKLRISVVVTGRQPAVGVDGEVLVSGQATRTIEVVDHVGARL